MGSAPSAPLRDARSCWCPNAYTIHRGCPTHGECPGCTCQYGPHTPIWYASVRTCSAHSGCYDAAQTPQWWTEGDARNWIAPRPSLVSRARRALHRA